MIPNQPTPGIAGLDHAVIAVRDLDAAQDTYARMGFTLAPRGLHSTGSTNHIIMLGRDYVELLTVPRPNPMQSFFYDFVQAGGDGLAALALAGTDAGASTVALREKGFEPATPLDLSRPITEGSRTGTARFKITNLAPRSTPGAQVFICQHFTRELVWQPELQQHANGALGIAAVAFIADNVAHQAGIYAKLFGLWPERIPEGMKIATGTAPGAAVIAVSTQLALQTRLAGAELPSRARPHMAVLYLRVKDRQETSKTLRAGGFDPKRMSDGSYAIDASQAHGVTVVFG